MIGQTFGNYQVTARIGSGGMGEVYRARDTKLGRDVAIKVLPEFLGGQAERLARFEREAKLLASLNHPHIAAIYGLEEASGKQLLVLELVDGEDLSQRLARGPLPVDEVVPIALQIAEALEAAHEQGIVHRDLKPANISLTANGQVKVLDFGLAKALDSSGMDSQHDLEHSPTVLASSPTVSGVILGTAAYMSPEQARGKRVDKRADIFAFGAVFMEMLTGKSVFLGETVSDTLAGVLRGQPPFALLPAETPPALRRLLERCLEKDPRHRLRDIGEARIVLEKLQTGADLSEGTEATSPARPEPGFARRYGGWITALLVVVLAVFWVRTRGSSNGVSSFPLRKSVLPMSLDDPARPLGFTPTLSPDGRYVVYCSQNELWLRDRTTVESRPIDGTEGARRPFWSPDGEWIGFGANQQLFKVPRVGGHPTLIAPFPTSVSLGDVSNACWTEDDRIVIGSGTSGLYRVSSQGGEMTLFVPTAPSESDFHEVCCLPNRKGFVFVVHNKEHGYPQIDAVTPDGDRHRLLQQGDRVYSPVYSPSGHIVFRRAGASAGIWALPFSLDRLAATGEPFLVAADASFPSVARDGTLSYVLGIREEMSQLVWVDRDGKIGGSVGRPSVITRPFPNLSPDENSVLLCGAFGDGREVFLYDVNSGNRRRLTFNELGEDIATWHPNGRAVLYYDTGSFFVHLFSLDGSTEDRIIARGIMACLTPDASQILLARKKPQGWDWDIFAQSFADSTQPATEIVATSSVDWWPALSPDGRTLLYVSNETGRDEVFATNFPHPTTRWQVSTEGGQWPRWRADGREIFFTTHEAIFAVDVGVSGGLTFGTPRRLFSRPTTNWDAQWADGFDVTHDGKRFIMLQSVREEDAAQPGIVIVQNWFAEFRRGED